jgi:hypothetical protein
MKASGGGQQRGTDSTQQRMGYNPGQGDLTPRRNLEGHQVYFGSGGQDQFRTLQQGTGGHYQGGFYPGGQYQGRQFQQGG